MYVGLQNYNPTIYVIKYFSLQLVTIIIRGDSDGSGSNRSENR